MYSMYVLTDGSSGPLVSLTSKCDTNRRFRKKEPASSEAPRSTQSIADSGNHTTISLPLVIQDGRTHYYLQYEDVCDPSKNNFMNIYISKLR